MNDPRGSDFSSTSPDDPTDNERDLRLEPKMGGGRPVMVGFVRAWDPVIGENCLPARKLDSNSKNQLLVNELTLTCCSYLPQKDEQGSLKPPPTGIDSKPGAHYCTSDDEVVAKCELKKTEQRIEIAPGIIERLRGSKETIECVERDFYLPCSCYSCEANLCCIMDAKYVLCPQCRVVSPLDACPEGFDGGVGLGFTFETLQQMQYEIVHRRRQSRGFR